MIFRKPKSYTVLQKKYPSTPAIALGEKIVHVGDFSSRKEYQAIITRLLTKYPKVKETDFVFTFIFGRRPYIV